MSCLPYYLNTRLSHIKENIK